MRKRDYKLEYQRRLIRAFAKGYSRSQARGHAAAGEKSIRSPPLSAVHDIRLEVALKDLRRTQNQRQAAKNAGISVERFRKFLRENQLAKHQKRQWVFDDLRPREITALAIQGAIIVTVAGFEQASLVGQHEAAVKAFLNTNDAAMLASFKGLSVTDTAGQIHFLEANPNAIHRLANSDFESFEMVYRLVY